MAVLPSKGPIANVTGSSQDVGSARPQHVINANADWHADHGPAANTKATATKPSAGPGKCNVVTGWTVTFCAGASAPTAIQVSVAILDGPSGSTNYLWGPIAISLPAVAGAMNGIVKDNQWRKGSPNTPVTIEFSVAGGAFTVESVAMEGTTVEV